MVTLWPVLLMLIAVASIGAVALYRSPTLMLVVLIGSLPLTHVGMLDRTIAGIPLTIPKLIVLGCLGLWVLRGITHGYSPVSANRLSLAYVLILGSMILSIPQALVPSLAWSSLQSTLLVAVLFHLVASVSQQADVEQSLMLLGFANVLLLLWGLLGGDTQGERLTGLTANANVWANSAVFFSAPCIGALGMRRGLHWQVLQGLIAFLVVINVGLAASRGAMLTLAVAGLVLCVGLRRKRLVLLLGTAISIFLMVSFDFTTLSERMGAVTSGVGDYSTLHRLDAFHTALAIMRTDLLTGVGVGQFPLYFATETGSGFHLEPHNMYLGVIAEQGIPGVLAYGYFFLIVGHLAYSQLSDSWGTEREPLFLGLCAAIVAWVTAGLLGGYMQDSMSHLWLGILLGLESQTTNEGLSSWTWSAPSSASS